MFSAAGSAARLADFMQLVWLSARMIAGRRFWIAPLLVLCWTAFEVLRLVAGWRPEPFEPVDAQGVLIGFPLTVLAVGLGVRVIAGEIDRRTLEIAYTVPGGAHRVWLAKIAAASGILIVADLLLALATFLLLTGFPLSVLYGAFQAAAFYFVLSMALAALFKSETTGAMGVVVVLILNWVFSGFGSFQIRISPFFNPLVLERGNTNPADLLAYTVQNRIGFVLIILIVTALAFGRADRRENLLGG